MNRVFELLSQCSGDRTVMPPTALYNEGWMLRLVLDWFASNAAPGHPLQFAADARWYSEALLPSQFAARTRSDTLAESFTHADGVIGHFDPRPRRGDLALRPDARQLIVTEAKMYSGLSSGTTRAKGFDQAARNVACIAHMLSHANIAPSNFESLSFFVIAPQEQREMGAFGDLLTRDSIATKVRVRCEGYGEEKNGWLNDWFLPTLEHVKIDFLSWERLCDDISTLDTVAGDELQQFYADCVRFNKRPFVFPPTGT